MAFKRCIEKGCKAAPRCKHPWHIKAKNGPVIERGPVGRYRFLLPANADGTPPDNPTSLDGAEKLEARLKTWLDDGRPKIAPSWATVDTLGSVAESDPNTLLLKTALAAYIPAVVKGSKDKSAAYTTNTISTAFNDAALSILCDVRALRRFVNELRDDECSAGTINRHLSRWSHLLGWCRSQYKLEGDSPFYHTHYNRHGVRKMKEYDRTRRLFTEPMDEEAELIKAAEKLDDGTMMLGRLFCAIDCGPRRGEMMQLRPADVLINHEGVKGYTLHFRASTTKTSQPRWVPVTSERLNIWLKARLAQKPAFLFGQADGTRLDSFRTDWEKIQMTAGLLKGHYKQREGQAFGAWVTDYDADLHWHDLRHECGTRLAQQGVPLVEIMTLLGHADLATTQKYLNPTFRSLAEHMARAHQELGV
jgi:integrase